MQGMENAIMQITRRSKAFDRGINADGVGGEEALSIKWPEDTSLNGQRRGMCSALLPSSPRPTTPPLPLPVPLTCVSLS